MAANRAILWLAVSSEQQAADDKESLRAQQRDLEAVALKEGWEIVDTLIVPGFSRDWYNWNEFSAAAALKGITAPQKMFDHWLARDFDVFAVRDGSRFGREQSIFAEVVARTLDSGARIYTLADGWITDQNRHIYISMAGYKAAKDISDLVSRRKTTLSANREKGLPPGPRLITSHRYVRDEKGRITGVVLNEAHRQKWDDLAALLLEGVYWARISLEMFNRFGYGKEGRAYNQSYYYYLVYSPTFWGHLAQNYGGKYAAGMGLWRLEPGHDIPSGVEISYNVIPAVYGDSTGADVIAELKRRQDIGHGQGRTNQVMWWRGLFLCASCGYNAVTKIHSRHRYAIRCASSQELYPTRNCANPAHITAEVARAWVTSFLERVLVWGTDAIFAVDDYPPDTVGMRAELARLEDRARKIIQQRLDFAGTGIENFYKAELDTTAREIAIVKARLAGAEREVANRRVPNKATIEELRQLTVERFWEMPGDRQNQMLHSLLGDMRMVIDGHEIVGFTRKLAT